MYDKTITIFNKYTSPTVTMWYPHVLHNVDLITDKGQMLRKYGPESSDNAELHIDYISVNSATIIVDSSNKMLPWVPPKEWKKQVNDLLGDTITFESGDFFMLGEWPEIPINDADYEDRRYEGFYAYMNAEKDYVYLMTSVGGPYTLIPHFEILGS